MHLQLVLNFVIEIKKVKSQEINRIQIHMREIIWLGGRFEVLKATNEC